MTTKILTLLLFLASQSIGVLAQRSTPSDTAQTDKPFETVINLQAVYRGDSVVLRWAPETPGAWREANKAGYVISRTRLNDDGSFDPATFLNLTAEPIRPWPLEQWVSIAGQNSKDDFAKVAAQALYGKSMVASKGFIGQADEFATRFSFGLLAADMSPAAARAMGLRFADRTIEKGKSYVYRMFSPVDPSRYKLAAGVVVVHTEEPQPVPQVLIDHVKENENMIEIFWKRDIHNPYFSAYYLERSDDNGRNFKRLNSSPFIHAVSENTPVTSEYFVYVDSIKTNYKKYNYRIIGITPFGELSPVSSPAVAMGRDKTPPPAPQNVQAKHAGGSRVRVSWSYSEHAPGIKGFLIGRGHNPSKEFVPLTVQPLSPKTREFYDDKADVMASNYYIVAVVDTAGNASVSLAQYAMIIDSIPPAPPTLLAGTIDTTGVVRVHWKVGAEKDLKGYYVYFANHDDHEFSQLTHTALQDTLFQDTITLKTLTKKIYYKVVAVDQNGNYSKFSEVLELKRPDVIPPTAPVLDHYKINEKGIELSWVASSSEDVTKTILYRIEDPGKGWKPIATFPVKANVHEYVDTTALTPGKMVAYSLVSFDESGLQSKRSLPIKLKFPDLTKYQAVTVLDARTLTNEKSILVTWNYPVKGDYRFVIYRAVNGSAFTSYKSVVGSLSTFKDNEVKKGSTYEYSVGVVFKNGKKAPYGKVVKAELI